jgi:hypothetical protein
MLHHVGMLKNLLDLVASYEIPSSMEGASFLARVSDKGSQVTTAIV